MSADLIAAASDAARQWHFNPQMKGGKPIDGYGTNENQVEKLN
jgi:hypothetical protein